MAWLYSFTKSKSIVGMPWISLQSLSWEGGTQWGSWIHGWLAYLQVIFHNNVLYNMNQRRSMAPNPIECYTSSAPVISGWMHEVIASLQLFMVDQLIWWCWMGGILKGLLNNSVAQFPQWCANTPSAPMRSSPAFSSDMMVKHSMGGTLQKYDILKRYTPPALPAFSSS